MLPYTRTRLSVYPFIRDWLQINSSSGFTFPYSSKKLVNVSTSIINCYRIFIVKGGSKIREAEVSYPILPVIIAGLGCIIDQSD